MDRRRIAQELIGVARMLAAADDEWTEYDKEYRTFVEKVVPKFRGRYKDGIAKFPFLNVDVEFSGNETAFRFTIMGRGTGKVFRAASAASMLQKLKDVEDMMM